jgi:L-alanine-DL-glutamate epimerase-like enolase superfamily enzyme
MKITDVRASWLCARIPAERAHVSDFGRNDSFNTCLVEIETDAGLVGLGEAKVGVGNLVRRRRSAARRTRATSPPSGNPTPAPAHAARGTRSTVGRRASP